MHTWILISSFVITITSPHNIRLQEKLEFGKKNSRGCWLVNFLKNKNMIRNDSNLLWKRSPYLLSTVWGASDILLTKSKDRRLYTTTRFYFRSSRVHNHCSSLWKKYHNHCVFLKKCFFKDRIIYTQSL